jgi:hypothetical protein
MDDKYTKRVVEENLGEEYDGVVEVRSGNSRFGRVAPLDYRSVPIKSKMMGWLGSIIRDAMIHQTSELRDQLNAVLGVESLTWGEALDMVSNLRSKPKVSEQEVDLYEKGRRDGMEEAERILTEHYKDRQTALKNSEASMKEAEAIAASARNFYERKLVERDGISSCLGEIRKRIEESDRC